MLFDAIRRERYVKDQFHSRRGDRLKILTGTATDLHCATSSSRVHLGARSVELRIRLLEVILPRSYWASWKQIDKIVAALGVIE